MQKKVLTHVVDLKANTQNVQKERKILNDILLNNPKTNALVQKKKRRNTWTSWGKNSATAQEQRTEQAGLNIPSVLVLSLLVVRSCLAVMF